MDDIYEELRDAQGKAAPDETPAPVTPVDAMFRSRDSELVATVLHGLDEVISTLR
jgi:hypothetical protein